MSRPALFKPLIEDCLRDGPKTVGEVVHRVGCTRQMAHKVLVEVAIGDGPGTARVYRLPEPGERAGAMAPVNMSLASKALKGETGPRAAVIDALNRHGGSIEDHKSGWATRLLFEAVKDDDRITRATPGHLSNLLNAMERDGLVTRLINGRRTYVIEVAKHLRREPEPEPEPVHLELVPEPEPEPIDPIDRLEDAAEVAKDEAWRELAEVHAIDPADLELPNEDHKLSRLALELLHTVGAILNRGGEADAELDAGELKVRLGRALEHAASTERKLHRAEEQVEALGAENRILKQQRDIREARIRGLESNMAVAIRAAKEAGADKDGKHAESFRAIERFMSAKPSRG